MNSKLDLIVLGATGFTGTQTVIFLANLLKKKEFSYIKWGIAGRSKKKMQSLLSKLQKLDIDTSEIAMIICGDILENESKIMEITNKTKIVVNVTGPNTVLSAPVVKACIKTGTDYIDISAELYHMLTIYQDFNKAAEEAGVLIIPACGFATIPVTAGLMYLERQFTGTLYTVECYTEFGIPLRAHCLFFNNALIHNGTFESMIHEFKNFKKYSELKRDRFQDIEPIPDMLNKSFFHRSKGKLWFPYPGPERDTVEQAQQLCKETRKSRYFFKIYSTMPTFFHFLILVPIFFIYYYLSCYLGCFRKLICKCPGFFTGGLVTYKGPTEKMRKDTKYSFTLCGHGWSDQRGSDTENRQSVPDKNQTVKISGNDPGYKTTAIAVTTAAITLLRERSKMPKGGVVATNTAFGDTQIVEALSENGIIIEIINN